MGMGRGHPEVLSSGVVGTAWPRPRSLPAGLCRRPPVPVDAGAGVDAVPGGDIGNLEHERILGAFAELDNNVPSELHPKHAAKLKKFFSPLI